MCACAALFAQGGQDASKSAAAVGVAGQDGPLAKYANPITITVPAVIGANVFFAEGENFEKNFVTDMYRDKLNLDYKAKWTVDPAQSAEKMNLAIATNDLPDMFQVDAVTLGRLKMADQIENLTSDYDKYTSGNLKKILEYQDKRGFLTGTFDGKLYGVPVSNDFANNLPLVHIRKDWLEKLGLKVPTTMDELLAVARAFRDRDPDGNGKKDTISIALNKTLGSNAYTLKALGNPLKAYYGIWVPKAGSLVYGSVQPEMKTALKLMQDLYKEGIFDLEFAVKDDGKVAEDIAAGKIGIYPGVFWNSLWPLAGSLDVNPKADWITIPLVADKDGKRGAQNTIFAYTWLVVRKGFSNPEALYKSMSLWYECFHGQYADMLNDMLSTPKYMPVADNWHGNAKPQFFSHPEKNLQLSANYIEARKANDPKLLKTGEARNRWALWQKGGSQGWAHDTFLMVSEPQVSKYDYVAYNEFLGTPTENMAQRKATLDKLEYEAFVKIIMGAPIDEFDAYVKKWKEQGGDLIAKDVNDWYKTVKK